MRIGAHEGVVVVVIPCLDEEATIAGLVAALIEQGVDQALVVDGGSCDRTIERAAAAGADVVIETRRGYGRACAAGVAEARKDAAVIAFMDGDGSDDPDFAPTVIGPVLAGDADFCMGSRLAKRGPVRALSLQQRVAGTIAGMLLRAVYGVRFSDMSPFRAIRCDLLTELGMADATYGWNLEMQMRAAARAFRVREVPVVPRPRFGGRSKVSGDPRAALSAAVVITRTFVRLATTLRAERVR